MEDEIFDWKSLLKTSNIEAVKVSCFNHAPGAKILNGCVVPGVTFIIRHYDAEPSSRSLASKPGYWVVTVMKVEGYFVLVRYLGMGRDASKDFWILLGKHEIYPVGREIRNAILMPPKFLLGRAQDWRTYFIAHISGGTTLPPNFLCALQESCLTRTSTYKVGDQLEVLDKYNVSQFRVGKVSKIVGGRLYLRYLDDKNADGFVCHEQSCLIHSMGWCACVGHRMKLPHADSLQDQLHIKPFLETGIYSNLDYSPQWEVKEGMKLEAVDPLYPNQICAATICKVLGFGYMMVKMDCYDAQDDLITEKPALTEADTVKAEIMGEDGNKKGISDTWFCYHISSPYIFKCGFCKRYGIPIAPPLGYENNKFIWGEYLEETKKVAAPLPEKPKLKHGFKVSMKLEMADVVNPTKIHPATIARVAGRLLQISFEGWETAYGQWLDAESPDIYPIGWSALVGHALETPKSATPDR